MSLESDRVKLYEPFRTLLVIDGGAGRAKHLRSDLVFMFVNFGLIGGHVTSYSRYSQGSQGGSYWREGESKCGRV